MEDPQPDTSELPTPPGDEQPSDSLRGTFVAVVAMASFFVVVWFGMLLLALERR